MPVWAINIWLAEHSDDRDWKQSQGLHSPHAPVSHFVSQVPAACFLWSSNKSAELMDVLPESLSSRALASYWKRFENKRDFISLLPPFEVMSDNLRDYRHLELKWTILKVVPISVFTSLTLSLPPSRFWVTEEWHLSLQPQGSHSLLVTLQLLKNYATIKNN